MKIQKYAESFDRWAVELQKEPDRIARWCVGLLVGAPLLGWLLLTFWAVPAVAFAAYEFGQWRWPESFKRDGGSFWFSCMGAVAVFQMLHSPMTGSPWVDLLARVEVVAFILMAFASAALLERARRRALPRT